MSLQPTVTLPIRRIYKPQNSHVYYVEQKNNFDQWVPISKGYNHSTSAFAALGRITQNQTVVELEKQKPADDQDNDICPICGYHLTRCKCPQEVDHS